MQADFGCSGQGRAFGVLELADLPAMLAIELGGHAYPWSEAVFRDCFKEGYERWGLWSTNESGSASELAGYALLCWQFDELHLLNLCVRRTLHRCGLGRRLLRFALAKAREARARCVLLEVRASNRAARALYRTEGFSEIGLRKNYYPAGHGREDALVMTLPLADNAPETLKRAFDGPNLL